MGNLSIFNTWTSLWNSSRQVSIYTIFLAAEKSHDEKSMSPIMNFLKTW